MRLSCSGDALNAAAAAAAAGGASVALVTGVGDDELGERIVEFLGSARDRHGVRAAARTSRTASTSRAGTASSSTRAAAARPRRSGRRRGARAVARRRRGPGQRHHAGALGVVRSGGRRRGGAAGGHVVYDPNFRAPAHVRRAGPRGARARRPARRARHAVVPRRHAALLGTDDAAGAARAVRALGARAVAVTMGASGVHVDAGCESLTSRRRRPRGRRHHGGGRRPGRHRRRAPRARRRPARGAAPRHRPPPRARSAVPAAPAGCLSCGRGCRRRARRGLRSPSSSH